MAFLNDNEKGIFYLFEKTFMPLFAARAGGSLVYDLPNNDVSAEVISIRTIGPSEVTRIKIRSTLDHNDIPPSVKAIQMGRPFTTFVELHRTAARDLILKFMGMADLGKLLNYAAEIRNKVNESLFVYCLAYAVIRRSDLRKVRFPALFEIFPSWFVSCDILGKAMNQSRMTNFISNPPERIVINHGLNFSGTTLNPENRLSYWREDYGINAHHWHWHLVFPLNMGGEIDRKGEIFYYMHQQMMVRYDIERLSNDLPRVKPMNNLRESIKTGYFPKLTVNNSRIPWGTRQDNTVLQDHRRNTFVEPFTIVDLEIWRDRLLDGIHRGSLINNRGELVQLSDTIDLQSGKKRGIDILGDTLEADQVLSVNYSYYGDLHNFGHILIAFAHDSDGAHREETGVMGDSATAMRDPVFYNWHKFVDDLFQTYKLTQPPYQDSELEVPNIVVESMGVSTGRDCNIIHTFFDTKLIEASRGLDFGSSTPVFVNLTRLNHKAFAYHILVDNKGQSSKRVTIRIFLAPKFNEAGVSMRFMEQRLLWAEMDKFDFLLQPGSNHIKQESSDSSITISEDFTFRDIETAEVTPESKEALCGCGWPQHMLIPKGKPEGMTFQLMVFLTDYEMDKVEDPNRGNCCSNAVSYCGILDSKFPDQRPMGFPFDRRPQPLIITVDDFVNKYGNAKLMDITIKFSSKELKEQN